MGLSGKKPNSEELELESGISGEIRTEGGKFDCTCGKEAWEWVCEVEKLEVESTEKGWEE